MKVERITVIGMGYVGLALALGLASKKYKVICVDSDEKKIKMLTNDQNYIYEEGFDECLKENKDFLDFCTKIPHDKKSDLYFVCVNTPSLNNGACDISRVKDVIDKILIFDKETPIIIKSTCEVGTSRKFQKYIYDKKAHNPIVFNPEFLAQGTAYENMIHPDRVVIGGEKKEALNTLNSVLNAFSANVIMTSWESAEIIKICFQRTFGNKGCGN